MKLERPIVFFDFETTGVDVVRDRVVQVACVRLCPDGSRETMESLVNPEMPIPAEVSAIHHITDDMVVSAPRFAELIDRLAAFFGDSDLGGFGAARFDVPMLQAEFKRAGRGFSMEGRRLIDAMVIFHKMEPRNLGAALEFYCGRRLEGAHDARADAVASLDVFLAQLDYYAQPKPGRPALPSDLSGLHALCNATDPRNVDPRGKFVWRDGVATFNFGKHMRRTIEEVVRSDRSYIDWLSHAESSSPEVVEICRKALGGHYPEPRKAAK